MIMGHIWRVIFMLLCRSTGIHFHTYIFLHFGQDKQFCICKFLCVLFFYHEVNLVCPFSYSMSMIRPGADHYRSHVIKCYFCFLNQRTSVQVTTPKGNSWESSLVQQCNCFIRNHVSMLIMASNGREEYEINN